MKKEHIGKSVERIVILRAKSGSKIPDSRATFCHRERLKDLWRSIKDDFVVFTARNDIIPRYKDQVGFTLIELLLYIGIVTIMLSAIIPFAWNIIGSGAKSSVQQEVYSQARFISEKFKAEIRNAQNINTTSSNFDVNLASTSGSKVSITTSSGTTETFTVANGKAQMTVGTGLPVNLNSNDTTVTDLTFSNYSSSDGKTKNLAFTLTIQYNNLGGGQAYSSTTSLRSDAEVRSN